jgi:hypothetical protein
MVSGRKVGEVTPTLEPTTPDVVSALAESAKMVATTSPTTNPEVRGIVTPSYM